MYDPRDTPGVVEVVQQLRQKGLMKMGYFMVGHQGEADTVKCIKCFGKIPHLPGEEVSKCGECGRIKDTILQVYVPLLPQNVQRILPESLQGCLIVFHMCAECLPWDQEMDMDVSIYTPEQIERLELQDAGDVPYRPGVVDNIVAHETLDVVSGCEIPGMNESVLYLIHDEISDSRPSSCYFCGAPSYVQGPECPGPGWTLFANLEEDAVHDLMWGDCGTAQIWVHDSEPKFRLTWACG